MIYRIINSLNLQSTLIKSCIWMQFFKKERIRNHWFSQVVINEDEDDVPLASFRSAREEEQRKVCLDDKVAELIFASLCHFLGFLKLYI